MRRCRVHRVESIRARFGFAPAAQSGESVDGNDFALLGKYAIGEPLSMKLTERKRLFRIACERILRAAKKLHL